VNVVPKTLTSEVLKDEKFSEFSKHFRMSSLQTLKPEAKASIRVAPRVISSLHSVCSDGIFLLFKTISLINKHNSNEFDTDTWRP